MQVPGLKSFSSCTSKVQALHLVGNISPLRDYSLDVHEPVQVSAAELPDLLMDRESVHCYPQLVLVRGPYLPIRPELPLRLVHQSFV